jgi:hypothetical protein
MKMTHSRRALANLETCRQSPIRARALGVRADEFAQDLNALVRVLVCTELLARLPQSLNEPATLALCLDRMRRLAGDAVRLVQQLSKSGILCQSPKSPVRKDDRQVIPVSGWKVVAFKKKCAATPISTVHPVSV